MKHASQSNIAKTSQNSTTHTVRTLGGGGGGGLYSNIPVMLDEFLLKSIVFKFVFKRNQSGGTRIYEYTPHLRQYTLPESTCQQT